jgi:hypothetical protein
MGPSIQAVRATIGGRSVDVSPAGDGTTYYINVHQDVKTANNDLVLTLEFSDRIVAVFKYQGKSIEIVGKRVTFSGFSECSHGEVTQFNVTQFKHLEKSLSSKEREKAERQTGNLLVNIYKAIPPPPRKPTRCAVDSARSIPKGVWDDDSSDEYDTDGGEDEEDGVADCASTPSVKKDKVVAYSNGLKSRINYHFVDDKTGEHLKTLIFTFVPNKQERTIF